MIKIPEEKFTEKLMKHIKDVYEQEAKLIVDRHKEDVGKELEYLMQELVSRAALRIEERMSIDYFGHEIRISILKDKTNKTER